MELNLSITPSVLKWYGEVLISFIPVNMQNCLIIFDKKFDPLSNSSYCGMPNLAVTFTKNSTVVSVSLLHKGKVGSHSVE